MLTIRFNRTGRKNRAHFRVVVQEHTVAPGGRHIEVVGSYDPHLKAAALKAERIRHWIGHGAQVSDTAWNVFLKEGIVEGKKRSVKMKRSVKAETPIEAAPVAEVQAESPAPEVVEKPSETVPEVQAGTPAM